MDKYEKLLLDSLDELKEASDDVRIMSAVDEHLTNSAEPTNYELWQRKSRRFFRHNKMWFKNFDNIFETFEEKQKESSLETFGKGD